MAPTSSEPAAPSATLIIVMGTSGSGKSTLGASLSSALGIPFIDGDDLHPPENVAKMAAGHPLNDSDREPWLNRIRKTAEDTLLGSAPTRVSTSGEDKRLAEVFETSRHAPHPDDKSQVAHSVKKASNEADHSAPSTVSIPPSQGQSAPRAMIIACSSLKRCYRDVLRGDHTTFDPSSPPCPPSGMRTLHLYVDVSPEELLRRMHERKGHFMKEEMLKSQLETLEKPAEGAGEEGVIVVADGTRQEVERRAEERLREALAA